MEFKLLSMTVSLDLDMVRVLSLASNFAQWQLGVLLLKIPLRPIFLWSTMAIEKVFTGHLDKQTSSITILCIINFLMKDLYF